VFEIIGHLCVVEAFQMTPVYHTGSNGTGCVVHELIEQVILACEDDGQDRFGVMLELPESLELGRTSRRRRLASSITSTGVCFLWVISIIRERMVLVILAMSLASPECSF